MAKLAVATVGVLWALLAGTSISYAQPGGDAAGRGFALIVGVSQPFTEGFGDAPAFAADAIAVAKVLARQPYYRGRIKLITMGGPRADSVGSIQGVEWTSTLPAGEVAVGDALHALAREASPRDLLLCYLAGHGTLQGGALRLVLPASGTNSKGGYLEFDRLADELGNCPAQIAYVIDGCQGANATYFDRLFSACESWRGVLLSSQGDEVPAVDPGGGRTLFGRVFEQELAGQTSQPVTFPRLAIGVQEGLKRLNATQTPWYRQWASGSDRFAVVSRPPRPALRAAPAWIVALRRGEGGALLPRADRAEALALLRRYAATTAAGTAGALTPEELEALRSEPPMATKGAPPLAADVSRAGAASLDTARVAALREYLTEAARQAPASPESYYARLAAAGIPPVIRAVSFALGAEPPDRPESGDPITVSLPFGLSVARGKPAGAPRLLVAQLRLLVAAAAPQVRCEPPAGPPARGGALLVVMPYLAPVGDGGLLGEWEPLPKVDGALMVPIVAPETELRLTVAEKGRDLLSTPRLVRVRCPRNLTVTAPLPGTPPAVPLTVKGRVWCETGTPRVMVGGRSATLGPPVEGVYTYECTDAPLPAAGNPVVVEAFTATGELIAQVALPVRRGQP